MGTINIKQIIKEELNNINKILNLFNSTDLNKYGSIHDYLKYLDTIFSNSKIKNIVYHGVMNQLAPKDGVFKGYITYFSDNEEYAKTFGFPINRKIIIAKINIQRLYYSPSELADVPEEIHNTDQYTNPRIIKKQMNNFDSVIGIDAGQTNGKTIAVFDPKQIHILGSKQDIEFFKKYMNNEY